MSVEVPTTRPAAAADARMQVQQPLRWMHFRALGAALLLLVSTGIGLNYYLARRMDHALARNTTLWAALQDSRLLIGYAFDMDASLRGFLLTGDSAQLANYELAVAELPRHMALLRERLSQTAQLNRHLTSIEQKLLQIQGEMTVTVMLYETHGRAAALQATPEDLGKKTMDELRQRVSGLERELYRTLDGSRGEMERLVVRRTVASYVTLLLVAVLGVVAMLLGAQHFKALRAQEQLRREVERRQRESLDKTNFLAQASHEIRTPMNAIFGFSGLLHDRLEDPVNRRYIESIMTSARALLALINDLLDLTRIEAGRIEIHVAPTPLRDIVDGVLVLFSQQASDKGLRLRAEIDPAVPAVVLVDGDRLRQMLVNLVGNAVKFTDAGEISVRVFATAEPGSERSWHCVFEVADTGVGIPHGEIEAIFEPFVQAHGHEGRASGTGLGLAITRQLARVMGGEVTARSQTGRGSTFRIELRQVGQADEPLVSGRIGGRLADLPPARVLVVDDVAMNREVLEAMFGGTEHQITLAASGTEGLELARQMQPDVVLLDLRMPDVDGVQVARRLRSDPRTQQVRILVITASNIASDAEVAELFDALILKPFTEQSLYRELARLLAPDGQPAETEPGTVAQQGVAAATVEQAIAALERLLRSPWPAIKDTLTMSEVREFAESIETLARQAALQPLLGYARKLARAAGSFDVARVEGLLGEYPAHIAELRRSVEPAAR